jgi:hypothetical protein
VLGTGSGLAVVWQRVARPYEAVPMAEAVLGLPHAVATQLVGAMIAASDEAEALLEAMPQTLRGLAIATTDRPQRCYGEIRGPVMWAETAAARSATAADPGLFVCATPDKAFDTDENRVLVSALDAIRRSGRDADHVTEDRDDAVLRRARHNSALAVQYLQHRTLSSVRRRHRPTPRALHRTRAGTRRRTYQPALQLLAKVAEPFSLPTLVAFSDERTRAQHDLLAALADGLELRGHALAPLRLNEGSLGAGPLWYRHARNRGDGDHVHGVLVGRVLVDVPDDLGDPDPVRAAEVLAARAGGRPSVVVRDAADVDDALDLAAGMGLDRR